MACSDSESPGTIGSGSLAFWVLFFFSGAMVWAVFATKMGFEMVLRGVIANSIDGVPAEATRDWVLECLWGRR